MNEIKITLQENEANALLQIIDVAVKAQGLQLAEVGSFLATKIQEQAKAQLPNPDVEAEIKAEALTEGE
tara:strand:+ start:189 stop:395 length:207 start_codon:yes stop_codon:yes gene_type:complete